MKEESLKNKAYKYIKDKIVSCVYEPGDFLDERELIKEIAVSRTPIREALNKIEQEKLIQILPKKGVIVAPITLKHIVDVYQIRELIEPAAILSNRQSIEKEKLLFFKEIFENNKDGLPANHIYNQDDEFHRYFISCYDNSYITNIMDEIRTQNQRIRIITGRRQTYCLDNAKHEHMEIISLLLGGRYEGAAESMKNHILLSKIRTMEIMQKMS